MVNIDGEDFYNTIVELGEKIRFKNNTTKENDWENVIIQYASIAPNRSNKAIATTEGSYLFTGAITFDNIEQQEKLVGSYFKGSTQPNTTYMLFSIFPENITPKFGIVSVYECNEKIDIISHYEESKEEDEFGHRESIPVYQYKNVDCYISSYNKNVQVNTVGEIEKTLSYLTIPAAFAISTKNIIMKDGFAFNEATKSNELVKIPYKVESIDTSMMDIVDGKPVGTLKCLLSEATER